MKEVTEEIVKQIVGKIYRDSMVKQSGDYFIKHTYTARQFESLIDNETFHSVIGFLPNTKYHGTPFIMGVSFNKKTKEYEITVHNPRVKF
jgi:hypothetical protein